jgi:hypothetical protein
MKKIAVLLLAVAVTLSGCTSKWVDVALADLPVLVNLVGSVVALADPSADKEIQEYAAEAGTDLQVLKALIDEYNAAPAASKATTQAKISATLAEVSNHLNAILAAAHVKNTVKAQHIVAAVNVAILTVNTIAQLMTNSKTVAQLPTPQQLQASVDDLKTMEGK